MKLAVHGANLTWPGGAAELAPTLAGVARAADQGGVTTLTMMDHWFQMEQMGGPAEPMLEGYTSLGFLAGQTERVELGLLVTGVTYRHPGLLAKIVATLDVLSGGRALFGIGAAWYDREHAGLGVPFPPTKERFERLEEAIQVCAPDVGASTRGPTRARTTSSPRPSAVPHRCARAGRACWSAGPGSARRCGWWRSTPTPATCSPPSPTSSPTSSRCSTATAPTWAATRPRCSAPTSTAATSSATSTASCARPRRWAALGLDMVWVGPSADDPVGSVGATLRRGLPRLEQLG